MTLFLRLKCLLVCCFIALLSIGSIKAQEITIGSKKFTESVVLGEITTHLLRESGVTVEHKQRMGGTIIVWEALKNGDIDIYPDYLGTIRQAILKSETDLTFDQMQGRLLEYGVAMTGKLGFNNTYAIAMRQLNVETILHPELHSQYACESPKCCWVKWSAPRIRRHPE